MKITLLIGSLLVSTFSFAQFNKGDHLISGSVGLSAGSYKATGTSPYDITKSSGVSLNLSGTTFVSNLVSNTVGFYVSNSSIKNNLNTPNSATLSSNLAYGISYSRTRLVPLVKSLYLNFPFTVNAGFVHATSEQGGGTAETRAKGFTVSTGMSAGLLYQLNKRWVLTLSLPELLSAGFNTSKSESYTNGVLQNPAYRSNFFSVSSGIRARALGDLAVGFGYIIPRKK